MKCELCGYKKSVLNMSNDKVRERFEETTGFKAKDLSEDAYNLAHRDTIVYNCKCPEHSVDHVYYAREKNKTIDAMNWQIFHRALERKRTAHDDYHRSWRKDESSVREDLKMEMGEADSVMWAMLYKK